MEICLIQIATSGSGIRRGRQVCMAICVSKALQCVWELEAQPSCDSSVLHEDADEPFGLCSRQ